MQPDGWDFSELKYVELSKSEAESWRLDRGDILFNRTNSKELVGKCEVFDQKGDWIFASYLMRLTVDDRQAIPAFVSAYLNSPSGRAQIARDSRQIIGMTNINAEEVRALRVPLPDLDTQRNLTAALNAARRERDRGLVAAEAVLTGLDGFILDALGLKPPSFPDLTRPFGHTANLARGGRLDPHFYEPHFIQNTRNVVEQPHRLLAQLVMFSDQTANPNTFKQETFRYLEIGNITLRSDEYILEDVSCVEAPSRARMLLQANDVVLSTTRPDRGAVARIRQSDAGAIASTGFAVLRGLAGLARDWLFEMLLTSAVALQLRQRSSGGAYPAITVDELAQIAIPWPTRELQIEVVEEVKRRRAAAQRLRAEARAGWEQARSAFEAALLGPAP